MKITHTDIYKFSIPMEPFSIATGTLHYAQNTFIRIHTEGGYGVGECSAFPMIAGETQATCFELAKDFAALWKTKDASAISERMDELHSYVDGNFTIKSAFDMALFDLAAKKSAQPLFEYLGGTRRDMETDITVGISEASIMAKKAKAFVDQGARFIKVKLGKKPVEDVERIRQIRLAVGDAIQLRIDANQGWTYEEAEEALGNLRGFNIEFCEQPLSKKDDHHLATLRQRFGIKIMADESVFDHYDAKRLIDRHACDYVNIKFAKTGGILEAKKVNAICEQNNIPCMMGGMLESRIALSAFAHFASAHGNIIFFDMDTCMLGHKTDPVKGGVKYAGFHVMLPNELGIGADADESFLKSCEGIRI